MTEFLDEDVIIQKLYENLYIDNRIGLNAINNGQPCFLNGVYEESANICSFENHNYMKNLQVGQIWQVWVDIENRDDRSSDNFTKFVDITF